MSVKIIKLKLAFKMFKQVMSSTLSHASDESGVGSLTDTISSMSLATVKPREEWVPLNLDKIEVILQ